MLNNEAAQKRREVNRLLRVEQAKRNEVNQIRREEKEKSNPKINNSHFSGYTKLEQFYLLIYLARIIP